MAIAREAGALLREGLGRGTAVTYKSSDVDLVTEYDTAAEALITTQLKAAFPGHRLVAEESGHHQGDGRDYVWYIDPLDGTNNFAHGLPHFAVSLALYAGQRPLLGVVYDPMRDECFSAVSGGGAQLVSGGAERPLRVSQAEDLLHSLLATGYPYDRHRSEQDNLAQAAAFLKAGQGLRRAGAAALDLAYVAAGRLDGYWEFKLKSWDVAAGLLLVQEAGGHVSTIDGRPLSLEPMLSLVASNGRIHPAMITVLERSLAPATQS